MEYNKREPWKPVGHLAGSLPRLIYYCGAKRLI